MPLVVAEVEDEDFVRLAGISRAAWQQTWFGSAFYPGPFAADDHERKADRLRQKWKKSGSQQQQQQQQKQNGQEEEEEEEETRGREGSHERWLKVIDTDLRPTTADGSQSSEKEHIISWGFARFFTEPKPQPPRNGKGDLMVTVSPCMAGLPGENDESIKLDYKKAALGVDKYWGGKRHVYIYALQTDPRHQHRGAATMLLGKWAEEADRLGLPLALTATPIAHELYLEFGFRTIGWYAHDLKQWGVPRLYMGSFLARNPGTGSSVIRRPFNRATTY